LVVIVLPTIAPDVVFVEYVDFVHFTLLANTGPAMRARGRR